MIANAKRRGCEASGWTVTSEQFWLITVEWNFQAWYFGIEFASIIPKPAKILTNDFSSRGLVKISASCSVVLTKWISIL